MEFAVVGRLTISLLSLILLSTRVPLPAQEIPPAPVVTPDAAQKSVPTNLTGRSERFWVQNLGTISETYTLSCSREGAVTSCSGPSSLTVPANSLKFVDITYSTGGTELGPGRLTLLASGIGGDDNGWFDISVFIEVFVTPRAAAGAVDLTRRANVGGYSGVFTVRNTGPGPDSYTLTCTGSANVTCGTITPSSLTNLAAGSSALVTVTYSAGAAGTGTLTLTATGASAGTDAGSFTVPVAAAGGPLVDFTPYNFAKQDYDACAVSCFAGVYAQSTVPYFSMDTPRNVTLVYNSDRVNPRPFVHIDVNPDTGFSPAEYRLQVKVNGAFITFVNGESLLRFAYPGRLKARLGAQFDASSYATNVYPMDILVTAYYSPTSIITTTLSTKLIVVNETSSALGAGWTLSGIQRFYPQSDGSALVTEGDGSAVYFAKVGNVLTPPAGEYSRLGTNSSSGWTRTYPDGSLALFDNTGKMTQLKDRFNNATTIIYDGGGRVVQLQDPAGKILILSYGANGLATIQDPGTPARVTTVTVDGSRKLTTLQDPDNISTRFTFDAALQLTSVIGRRADTTQLAYDGPSKRMIVITYPKVPVINSGTVSPTESHFSWQVVGVPYSPTAVTAATAPLADTVRARIVDSRGLVTSIRVDRFGAVRRLDDALGRTTLFTRDADSRVVRDSSPSGHVVRRTWSGPNMMQIWDSSTGQTANFAYETTYNQLIQVTGDVDSLWNYWSTGRLDSTVAGARAISNPLRRKTSYAYDPMGRVLSATDPRSHPVTFYYNPASWRNMDSVKADTRRTGYTYDPYGRVTTVKTPLNQVSTSLYDAINRRVKAIGPIADTTIFTYDSLLLRQVRDANGQTYQFARNAMGWVISRTDPAGKQDLFEYDSTGNLRRWTNRRNQMITWAGYENLNRPTLVTSAEGKQHRSSYDAQDRFSADSNATSIDTLRFDVVGRLTSEITIRAGTRYEHRDTFNIRGLRTMMQIVSPWTDTILYHYNGSMLLDTLTDLAGGRTAITYNSDMQPTGATLPTGLVITRGYPSTHKPQQITFSDATINSAIGAYYSHNTLGKIEDRGDPAGVGGRDFIYDMVQRLAQCGDYTWQASGCDWYCDPHDGCRWQCVSQQKSYSQILTFAYDSVGNRHDFGAAIAPGNRLVKFNGDSLAYDDDGNLVKRIRGGQEIQRLWWNSLGQLVAVWTSGQDSVTLAYDGFGRRVTKQKATSATHYIYDGDDLLAEVDSATSSRLVEYTYYPGIDQPHSERVGGPSGQVYYYVRDFPGSVIGLINSSNTLVNNYEYEPFGADGLGSTATVSNTLKFAARPIDSETGLYYVRARYYDPQIGRFVSEDPIGLAGGINRYSYVLNDPVNQRDPSGECPWCALIGAGVGASFYLLKQAFTGERVTLRGVLAYAAGGALVGFTFGGAGVGVAGRGTVALFETYVVEAAEVAHPVALAAFQVLIGTAEVIAAAAVQDIANDIDLGKPFFGRGLGGTNNAILAAGWSRFYPAGWGRGLYDSVPGTFIYYFGGGATVEVPRFPEVKCGLPSTSCTLH